MKNTPSTSVIPKGNSIEAHLAKLKETLPLFITRKMAGEHLEGIISPRTLANLDRVDAGPPSIRIGKKIAYQRDDFLEWLKNRIISA